MDNIDVYSEDGARLLIRSLRLRVSEGMRLLVTGPSGCGKSTLLRVMASMCYHSGDDGVSKGTFVCPQTPYLFKVSCLSVCLSHRFLYIPSPESIRSHHICTYQGSLSQNLLYPRIVPDISNDGYRLFDVERMWLGIRLLFLRAISPDSRTHDARQNLMDDQYLPVDSRGDNDHFSMKGLPSLADQELVLQLVGLPQFSQHLNRSMQCFADDDDELSKVRQDSQQQQRDWSSTASLGEKQRIAVARVLLHHPKLVTYTRTTKYYISI